MKNRKTLIALVIVLAISLAAMIACKPTGGGTLTAPQITLSGKVVSWNAVEHADSYDVTVGSDSPVNVKTTSYTVDKTAEGSYDITVVAKSSDGNWKTSAASNKVTFVVDAPAPTVKTLTALEINADAVKAVYYVDEGVTELDLTGLVAVAKYDNNTSKTLAISDLTVGEYDLKVLGDVMVEISYSEGGVTKKDTLFVEVKQRGIEDVDYTARLVEYDASGKYDLGYTAVNDMSGVSLVDGGRVKLSQGKTLVNADGNFVLITVAKLIDSVEDFAAIADDLDGYYVLTKDIDFQDASHTGSYIGAAPLDATNTLDYQNGVGVATTNEGLNNAKGQLGVAFTGTFDGQGYALANLKLNCKEFTNSNLGFGLAIFGYLGEDGVIANVTLRNVTVSAGKYSSFLVGYNKGTIENICVESTCTMKCSFSYGYIAAGYNDGKVNNVVSYVSQYTGWSNSVKDFTVANNSDVVEDAVTGVLHGTSEKCYVGDNTDLTATLGNGWKFFDGFGTVLVNDDYMLIVSADRELPLGGKLVLDTIFVNGDKVDFAVYYVGSKPDGVEGWGCSELKFGFENGHHYAMLDPEAEVKSLKAGDKVKIVIHASNWNTQQSIEITIVAPVVVDNEVVDCEELNVIEGMDIDLNDITIKQIYSDGTEQTIHPIKIENFDKNGTVGVAQTVKAFYGEGEDDYLEIDVTLTAKSVTGIAIDSESSYKTLYNVDDELDLTGVKIVVTYNNGTQAKVDVTSDMLTASSYDMSAAASYNVEITYSEQTCTFNITVKAADVTVTGIAIAGTPAKTTYKLNETVVLADLAGATITATNSDGSTLDNIAITLDMLDYDFTAAGSKDITVSYEEQTATITVTVVDYATELTVTPKQTTLYYDKNNALDLVANATYSVTMASGATKSVTDGVTVSAYQAGRNTITYTYTGDYATVTATQDYDIWYELTGDAVEEWAVMQANLAGYYRLTKDLDFNNRYITPIGQAPIKVCANPDDGCEIDKDITDSIQGLPARAFTGKFDGQGYTLKNAKIADEAYTQAKSYCLSLFGFVGEGGSVRNVTMKGINIHGGKLCSIVAGYNLGLIENIFVADDCYVYSNYNGGYVVSALSYGTINNVVSHLTTFDATTAASWGGSNKPISISDGATARITNCFIKSDENFLTDCAVLGEVEGWGYDSEYGAYYYGARGVVIIMLGDSIAVNGELEMVMFCQDDSALFAYFWGANAYGDVVRKDGTDSRYTITIASASQSSVVVGETYTMKVNVAGTYYSAEGYRITIKESL